MYDVKASGKVVFRKWHTIIDLFIGQEKCSEFGGYAIWEVDPFIMYAGKTILII